MNRRDMLIAALAVPVIAAMRADSVKAESPMPVELPGFYVCGRCGSALWFEDRIQPPQFTVRATCQPCQETWRIDMRQKRIARA